MFTARTVSRSWTNRHDEWLAANTMCKSPAMQGNTSDMPEPCKPRVTIGIPVFNGQATIASAIESLLEQTYENIKLIISDNASTDGTGEICRSFAETDTRVEYHRQSRNIGGEANFDFVLQQADTEYFMWGAADDLRSPDYLSLCVDFLDTHPDYVAAGCQANYIGNARNPVIMADRSLDDDDPYNNITNVFDHSGRLHVNSRFYALFRRDAILFWLREPKNFLGMDWVLVIKLLKHGKYKCIDSGYLALGNGGASKQLDIFAASRTSTLHWLIPFLQLSREAIGLLASARRAQKFELLKRLFYLNARIAKRQISYEFRRRRV